MSALSAVRDLLPFWVTWGGLLFFVPLAFLLSLVGAGLGAVVVGGLTRRAPPESWAERARLAYPIRLATALNLFCLPLLFGFSGFQRTGPLSPLPPAAVAALSALAAFAGALLARVWAQRRLRLPRRTVGARLRSIAFQLLILNSPLIVLGLLALLLPATLDGSFLAVFIPGVLLLSFFAWGGGILVARVVGLARPASARLAAVVERAASGAGVRPRATYEVLWLAANALAFRFQRTLAFTDTILKTLDDDELTAVCAHELGHLTEPPALWLCRVVPIFFFLPLVAWRTYFDRGGLPAVAGAFAVAVASGLLARRLARRMEYRADRAARAQEGEAGTYARALEKIHEANLVPAVLAGKGTTHPHLYDRLEALGVTPAYQRPRPPSRWRVPAAYLITLVVGVLGGVGPGLLLVWAYPLRGSDEQGMLWHIAWDGGNVRDLDRLAALRERRGDEEGAVVLYRGAAALDPNSVYRPVYLAILLSRLGRCDEAEAACRDAEERCRRNGERRSERALVDAAWSALGVCRKVRAPASREGAALPGE